MKTLKRERLIRPYRVTRGEGFRLKDFDPGDAQGLDLKAESDKFLSRSVRHLSDIQEKLHAQNHWALLLIFQGMDAAGKDGAIRHVMSGVNPQGCRVCSFQSPSAEELEHDFLWRASRCLPKRGQIGIFNRSYYEEVLVVRVHPELLQAEKIPSSLVSENIWKERFEDINAYERFLTRNGTVMCKFFLNLSKQEQRTRFLSRLDEPDKNWKFSADDVRDRDRWDDYMHAYEDMIAHTATEYAPWYVIPADHKWFARMAISAAILETAEELKLTYPRIDGARRKQLREARRLLEREKPTRS